MTTSTSTNAAFECPGCRITAPYESWRKSDGPCRDGLYYCTGCLGDGKCGCLHNPVVAARSESAAP